MAEARLLKHEVVSLQGHPDIDEAWVHERIKENPRALGLGDLIVKDSERRQTKAGRLDLLLADRGTEPERRYELEVQLGSTDASHIIRTIEYWDLERRRFPQYDHVAVIAAEDITTRFFNVIHLLNRAVPIIALKMVTLQVEGGMILHFVKVLDETAHRADDEEEAPTVDRAWWVGQTSGESMNVVDSLFESVAELDSGLAPHFTQSYIVPRSGLQNREFLSIVPKKKFVRIWVYLPNEDSAKTWVDKLKAVNIEGKAKSEEDYATLDFRLAEDTLKRARPVVRELLELAYKEYGK